MADGHRNDCKKCNLAAKKARYDKDPKTAIARVKAWQQANPERMSAYRRKRYAEDPERFRADHLRRKFGMSLAEYDAILEAQGGGCAICGDVPKPGESFHVDHLGDVVRGILCVRCNNALGQLREDVEIAGRAVDYLDSNGFASTGQYELRDLARVRARGLVKAPG